MAVVFRSADIPVEDREAATRAAFLDAVWPTTVELDDPATSESVLEVLTYGNASIFRAHLVGMRLSRSVKQIRTGPSEMLGIAVQESSVGRHDQFDTQHVLAPRQLMICDLNTPYDFWWSGPGGSQALHIPIADIALPPEVIATAATRLPASPLYDLVSSQILELTAAGDSLAESTASGAVGATVTELARAFLASAYDGHYARGAMAEVLLPRIRSYIRQHLTDADLTADSIAHAHDISTRKLFRLCNDADFSLEQWIINRRLEGSRDDLARPETRDVTVSAIARRWGFTNTSHFSRRFREEYGLTPRTWREQSISTVADHA